MRVFNPLGTTYNAKHLKVNLFNIEIPQNIEILGWCPAKSVLLHGEKVLL